MSYDDLQKAAYDKSNLYEQYTGHDYLPCDSALWRQMIAQAERERIARVWKIDVERSKCVIVLTSGRERERVVTYYPNPISKHKHTLTPNTRSCIMFK